ncbi:MAG TPA: Asp-tRNA(Asn)/Glu-tRNA(Gln) amidotransferase GatCAB subunit A [Bacteroidetes bacterium]|nr:Asp-tRNA(Asn)/Glu-tRNA(Gln) amidotransferase GatCAB subunit A [Bacteroidota bacterium]
MEAYSRYSTYRSNLIDGTTTCVATVQEFLKRAEEKKHLNAFLELWPEEALQRAKEIDAQIQSGNAGKLAGMVIALKDNICYAGHRVSNSSKILLGFESLYSSTVTERLLAEGVIFIGRTNCDEFAMGASNENSAYGPVLNADDEQRVPGGSSGGSAVAVQAGLCHAALGSDTGGSIRQPASFTGTVGFKPTYGTISRHGLLAYASSFDQIGPITRSVEDTALLCSVMAGPDAYDATMIQKPAPDFALTSPGKKKIAYLRECIEGEGISPEIVTGMKKLIANLQAQGHQVEEVSFPYIDYLVPCYYVLTTAEASSNLARYQGLHYGYRSANATDLESSFKKSRSEGFGPEVKRRIMLGTFVLSEGFYDAYYTKAQKVRRFITNKTEDILKNFDFILMPTTPTPAFKIGEKANNPVAMYLADIFTVQANITGMPAISIPGPTKIGGLSWGIQLMAARRNDVELLSFAHSLQESTATHEA